MYLDDCKYTFKELANNIFPSYFEQLRNNMKNSLTAISFIKTSHKSSFGGCYVFFNETETIYVGISKNILLRIKQHIKGTRHNQASLAYRMAKNEFNDKETRDNICKNQKFVKIFSQKRKYLENTNIAYITINNPIERYLFEVYVAMELNSKYNTFITH